MWRLDHINRFYEILQDLEKLLGGKRRLAESDGKMNWPRRGVYFFFEPGEERSTGPGLRVVRVGTHALKPGSKSTLWQRLRTHRGTVGGRGAGGGNHRGSIFRLHVGTAIMRKEGLEEVYPRWGVGSSAPSNVRRNELPLERKVSQHIRDMPFLWLRVDDPPGSHSKRVNFEKNSIILLSNYGKLGTTRAIDPPSANWIGKHCKNEKVRQSGLWNDEYVQEERLDHDYLDKLEAKVRQERKHTKVSQFMHRNSELSVASRITGMDYESMSNSELIAIAAKALGGDDGRNKFTRPDIMQYINHTLLKDTSNKRNKHSLNPMIQALTVNALGGAPGGGEYRKRLLWRVTRGVLMLYNPHIHCARSVTGETKPLSIDRSTEEISLEDFHKLSKTKGWEEKEGEVRQVLGKKLNTSFEKKKLLIGYKSNGTLKEHEFDLVSSDGKIIGEVKTFKPLKGGGRPSGKIDTTFQACYLLEKVIAQRKLLVLTDKKFYEIFKKESDGIVSKDIEILHVSV